MRKLIRTIAALVAASLLPGGSAYADAAPPAEETATPACVYGKALSVAGGNTATVADACLTLLRTEDPSEAPDWTLGVTGEGEPLTVSGRNASLNLVRCQIASAGWGLVSNDEGCFAAVDADLAVAPDATAAGGAVLGYDKNDAPGSGYGLYCGPGSESWLYGVSVSGVTYGAALDGAESLWLGSSAGTIPLYDADGSYTGVTAGQGRTSSIDGVFGLLLTGDAAQVTVNEGTAIHSRDAAVLYKGGSGAVLFDNARIASDSGVLLQMMDDDGDQRVDGGYYDERDAGGETGFPGVNYDYAPASGPDDSTDPSLPPAVEDTAESLDVTFTYGLYRGDIYNGTGWYGQRGDSLAVTVGRDAVLYGDAALTATIKAVPCRAEALDALSRLDGVRYALLGRNGRPCQEENAAYIQFSAYTQDQYYLQGHVQNKLCAKSGAALDVTVAENGTWAVRERSLISSLTVERGGTVYARAQVNADGTVVLLPSTEPLLPGHYGTN